MRKVLALVPFALATFSNHVAHADVVGSDEKNVQLSIRVDGDVPEGQTVVLGRTWRIFDIIKPGTVAPVEWHPSYGPMHLAVVPSSVVANLQQLVQERKSNEIKEIFKQSKPCHDGFNGFRTIPRSAPTDVVHWNFRVTFAGEKCTATLVSMQFFKHDGAEVEPRDFPIPPGVLVGAPGSARPAPPPTPEELEKFAKLAARYEPEPEPTPAPKSSCGCRVGPGADELDMAALIEKWGPLGSFAIFALALGLRRKSGRKRQDDLH